MANSDHIDPNSDELLELLYDELDEGRAVQARQQLEQDPDQSAVFASYERVRELVANLPEEDPPAAVSAQLMHAAASAQKSKRRGVLTWLGGLFHGLSLHPGLAAAASLVLVVGIAGTFYLTGKKQLATPVETSSAPAPVPPPQNGKAAAAAGAEQVEGFTKEDAELDTKLSEFSKKDPSKLKGVSTEGKVIDVPNSLRDKRRLKRKPSDSRRRKEKKASPGALKFDEPDRKGSSKSRSRSTKSAPAQKSERSLLEQAPAPLSNTKGVSAGSKRPSPAAPKPVIRQQERASAPAESGFTAAPKAKEDVPTAEFAKEPPASSAADGDSASSENPENDKQIKLRELHSRAQKLAKGKQCGQAMTVAAQLRRLDATYYKKSVAPDRRLARCYKLLRKASKKAK